MVIEPESADNDHSVATGRCWVSVGAKSYYGTNDVLTGGYSGYGSALRR